MFTEDDLIPISALQHMAFCERQMALIHIEGLWSENVLTVEGENMHERVHGQEAQTSDGVYSVRGLRVRSLRLGLIGMTDLVEFHKAPAGVGVEMPLIGSGHWRPYIVEYKHGKPKIDRSDEVQLCAQAICLEEMLGVTITESAFFYGCPRRRQVASLDAALRTKTEEITSRVRVLLQSGITPAPVYTRRCRQCSLVDVCLPKTLVARHKVDRYLRRMVADQA